MAVFAQTFLLRGQHPDKAHAVAFFLQRFEHGFLRLGHRTPDAMAFAFELAHVDTGAGCFCHGKPC